MQPQLHFVFRWGTAPEEISGWLECVQLRKTRMISALDNMLVKQRKECYCRIGDSSREVLFFFLFLFSFFLMNRTEEESLCTWAAVPGSLSPVQLVRHQFSSHVTLQLHCNVSQLHRSVKYYLEFVFYPGIEGVCSFLNFMIWNPCHYEGKITKAKGKAFVCV